MSIVSILSVHFLNVKKRVIVVCSSTIMHSFFMKEPNRPTNSGLKASGSASLGTSCDRRPPPTPLLKSSTISSGITRGV